MELKTQNHPEKSLETEAVIVFNELLKNPAIVEALNLLDSLPKNLKYHDKGHTLDVMKETILFALADELDRKTIELQTIAAAWHDVGYLKEYNNNEPIAVEMFQKSKAFQTLSTEEKAEIIANILDTQIIMKDDKLFLLKQRSKLGYILDGDVSSFGREDFFEKRMEIAEELGLDLSNVEIKKKFYASGINLLRNHEWKTESAKKLRQAQKEINLRKLEEEYAKLLK
ncbi:MAG: HD domain-containing protein [Candidatus Paceibacterota bacterium]